MCGWVGWLVGRLSKDGGLKWMGGYGAWTLAVCSNCLLACSLAFIVVEDCAVKWFVGEGGGGGGFRKCRQWKKSCHGIVCYGVLTGESRNGRL